MGAILVGGHAMVSRGGDWDGLAHREAAGRRAAAGVRRQPQGLVVRRGSGRRQPHAREGRRGVSLLLLRLLGLLLGLLQAARQAAGHERAASRRAARVARPAPAPQVRVVAVR